MKQTVPNDRLPVRAGGRCGRMCRGRVMGMAALGLAVTAAPARGQVVTVPTHVVAQSTAPSSTIQSTDVAVGIDGTAILVWNEAADSGGAGPYALVTRRLSDQAAPLAASIRTESPRRIFDPRLSAGAGGYFAVWRSGGASEVAQRDVLGRRLDLAGIGTTGDLDVDAADDTLASVSTVVTRPAGPVFVWGDSGTFAPIRYRPLQASGEPVLPDLTLPFDSSPPYIPAAALDGAATPSGGHVFAWERYGGPIKALVFDAAGIPQLPEFVISDGSNFAFRRLAVSPRGDVIAVAGVKPLAGGYSSGNEVWIRRATIDGIPLGADQLVHADPPYALEPDLEFDANGNLLVVWTAGTAKGPYARGFDAAGDPLGPPVSLGSAAVGTSIRTTRLENGDFLTVWNAEGAGLVWGSVVSLCVPGTSTCGDGVLAPLCEQCDAGAGNSDTAPDACRTNCRPARCGDGTVDAGETCDDGNRLDCDGCSALCALEAGLGCGDGVAFPTCGEQCDDQNAIDGDGCSAQCTLQRIPGGGKPSADCHTEWMVDNAANEPLFDVHGVLSGVQRCTDGDPRCDFDGGVAGSCTFHLRVCANNTDLSACKPSSRLATWELQVPSAKQAAKDPSLAALRSALLGTVPGSIVGPGLRDLCTDSIPLVVPLRVTTGGYRAAKRKLKSNATLYSGEHDVDKLRLECLPAVGVDRGA